MPANSPFTIDIDPKRIYGLDILRATAIFLVLCSHSAHFLDPNGVLHFMIAKLGVDGVPLFFVLSGFLIGGIMLKQFDTDRITLKQLFRFWVRRWFRTLPAYFVVVLILLYLGMHFKTVDTSRVKSYIFFIANFNTPMPDQFFPESWSLAVEEWFYLLVPLAFFILIAAYRAKPKRAMLIVVIMGIVLVTAFRYYRFSFWEHITWNEMDGYFRKQVITRLDCIMYGVLGAYLYRYHHTLWIKYKKALFFTGILLIYTFNLQYWVGEWKPVYNCVWSYSVEAIGILLLLPYLTELRTGSGWFYRMVTRLSIISYAVYLLNYSIVNGYIIGYMDIHVFGNVGPAHWVQVHCFTFWFLSIGLSVLFYKFIEKPLTGLRDAIA